MSDIIQSLPDVLPRGTIVVDSEAHEYESIEYEDGTVTERTQYVPDKAPFESITSIDGIVDGSEYTFDPEADYQILDTDNDGLSDTIDFGVGGATPDPGSEFTITYQCESVLSRYVGSYGTELHTIDTDIERVIDSHYVEKATQCRPIDSFEDQQLVEYTFDSGGAPNATVQSDIVFDGEWALELNSACVDEFVRLVSRNGLTVYPQRGDYFIYHARLETPKDRLQFDFMYQNGDVDRFYRIELDADSGQLSLSKHPDSLSNTTQIADSDITSTWYRVDVTVENTGPITVELVNTETGGVVGSVSMSDTEYESGGIRWAATNPTCQSEVYVDMARVIDRLTGDLDRIGALFGELGRRRGRDDDEYVDYLKSIVGSFSGRGTVPGIKQAVASSLGTDTDDISVSEDFDANSYQIIFDDWPDHRTGTITTVAELADPSGIDHQLTEYNFSESDLEATDEITGLGIEVDTAGTVKSATWDQSNWDTMRWDPQLGTSAMSVSDQTTQDIVVGNASPDSWDVDSWDSMVWDDIDGFEATGIDDTVAIDAGKSVSDTSASTDSVTVVGNDAIYDASTWDDMVWT